MSCLTGVGDTRRVRGRQALGSFMASAVVALGLLVAAPPVQASINCQVGSIAQINTCIGLINSSADTTATITLTNGFVASGAITAINPTNVTSVTIDGNDYSIDFGSFSGFEVTVGAGRVFVLKNLRSTGGSRTGSGGVLRVTTASAGTVTILNNRFSGAAATENGGAVSIDSATATVTVSRSTFSNNTATTAGGGLYSAAAVTMQNSTFYSNTAQFGGGAVVSAAASAGASLIQFSTFSSNSAGGSASSIDSNAPGTQISLVGSVLADPRGTAAANCRSAVASGDYAVIGSTAGTDASCGAEAVNDIDHVTTSALGFGAFNTGTGLLTPGAASVLVNYAPNALGTGITVDQGGTTRSGAFTVGSVQVGAPSLSASALEFGTVTTGSTATASLTVTNSGSADLTFGAGAVTLTGADASLFAITADTCSGSTVVVAASCTVTATFGPTSTGLKSASLTFVDNAADSPQSVAVTGTGAAPAPSGGGSGGSSPSPTQTIPAVPTSGSSAPIAPEPVRRSQQVIASVGFTSGTARILPRGLVRLQAVARGIPAQATDVRVVVTAYPGSSKPTAAQRALARKRAEATVSALRASGLDAVTTTAIGSPRGSRANQANRVQVVIDYQA